MAFVTGAALPTTRVAPAPSVCGVRMSADNESAAKMTRRAALAAAMAAVTAVVIPRDALANREYANVGFLGGGDKVDVNNANVRVYAKYPGMYPTLAGLIVTNGPFKSVEELYKLPGITETQKATLDKYKDILVALEPAPEYEIDKINNGLYRYVLAFLCILPYAVSFSEFQGMSNVQIPDSCISLDHSFNR